MRNKQREDQFQCFINICGSHNHNLYLIYTLLPQIQPFLGPKFVGRGVKKCLRPSDEGKCGSHKHNLYLKNLFDRGLIRLSVGLWCDRPRPPIFSTSTIHLMMKMVMVIITFSINPQNTFGRCGCDC